MESSSISSRLKKISEISTALMESEQKIEKLLETLNWDKKQLTSQQNIKYACCPVNAHHMMKPADLDRHIPKCRMRQSGCSMPKSSSWFYHNSSAVISVTPDIASNSNTSEVPAELDIYLHTPEERLSQYDEDVKRTSSKRKAKEYLVESELSGAQEDSKEMAADGLKSELQLLAEKRDYKRRRQSYRAKNVHITKRTPIEIMREIINNRMEEMQHMSKEMEDPGNLPHTIEDK